MDYTVYAIQEEGKFTGNDRSQIFFFRCQVGIGMGAINVGVALKNLLG